MALMLAHIDSNLHNHLARHSRVLSGIITHLWLAGPFLALYNWCVFCNEEKKVVGNDIRKKQHHSEFAMNFDIKNQILCTFLHYFYCPRPIVLTSKCLSAT